MLAAVLEGDGLEGVAELAAAQIGGPVAIVLPARTLAAASRDGPELEGLTLYVSSQVSGQAGARPASVEVELPVLVGRERIGAVLALTANGSRPRTGVKLDREEVLRNAAVAALAEVAATDARDRLAEDLRGSLLEDLRGARVEPGEALEKGGPAGLRPLQGRGGARSRGALRKAADGCGLDRRRVAGCDRGASGRRREAVGACASSCSGGGRSRGRNCSRRAEGGRATRRPRSGRIQRLLRGRCRALEGYLRGRAGGGDRCSRSGSRRAARGRNRWRRLPAAPAGARVESRRGDELLRGNGGCAGRARSRVPHRSARARWRPTWPTTAT